MRSILYAIDDKAAFRAAIYFLASALEWGIMGTLIIAQGPARRREYIYLRKQKELASIATEVTEVPEVIVSSETDTEENKKDATEIDTKSTDQASQKVSKARRKRMQHVKKSQAMEHSVTTSEDSDKSSDQASQKASKTRRKHRQGVEKSKPMRHSADGAEESSIV